MKHFITTLICCITLMSVQQSAAQTSKAFKVAVIIPIYMDSAFNGMDYKLGMNNIPKYMLPGLDFYNGIMFAIDSLQQEGIKLEVSIYDSKNARQSLNILVNSGELNNANLIIASCNNKNEVKLLADLALSNKIPLISATFPNDGGVSNNPYFVMLNSNLYTHLEQLYKYIQKNHASQNIVLCKKKGTAENTLQSYITEINYNASIPLVIKTVELSDTFTTNELIPMLDSTEDNLLICSSLNEAFGLKLVKTMSAIKTTYNSTILGMPTWEAMKDFDKIEFGNGLNIVYSTPFYFPRKEKPGADLVKKYSSRYISKPSEMFFKGYEDMYHFGKLLYMHSGMFVNHIADSDCRLFNEFKIEATRSRKDHSFQYLENKKIYILKRTDKGIELMK